MHQKSFVVKRRSQPKKEHCPEKLSQTLAYSCAGRGEQAYVAWIKGHTYFHGVRQRSELVTRPRDLQDNTKLSALSIAAFGQCHGCDRPAEASRLYQNDLRYVDIAHQALLQLQTPTGGVVMSQHPLGFGQWLQALINALSKPREIATVGDPDTADSQPLLDLVRSDYRPFQDVALGAPSSGDAEVPMLQDRGLVDGKPAAHVCRSFTCQASVTEPEKLWALLQQRSPTLMPR